MAQTPSMAECKLRIAPPYSEELFSGTVVLVIICTNLALENKISVSILVGLMKFPHAFNSVMFWPFNNLRMSDSIL